jgi:hypothetical protein
VASCGTRLGIPSRIGYFTCDSGVGVRSQRRAEKRSEIRDQRSEIRDQRSEIRDQRSEIRDQRSESREQRAKSREQRAESRRIEEFKNLYSITLYLSFHSTSSPAS